MKTLGYRPPAGVDWTLWAQVPKVQLWEAVALSCNIEPDKLKGFDGDFDPDDVIGPPRPPEFSHRLKIACRSVGDDLPAVELRTRDKLDRDQSHLSVVRLPAFAAWAKGLGWNLPDEFPHDAKAHAATHPWGSHDTKLLRALAAAAEHWWKNYDPEDPTTAPKNGNRR